MSQTIDETASRVDPLSMEIVVGGSDVDSTKGQERRDTHRVALEARAKGDLDGMFAAYRTAVESRAETEKLWMHAMHIMGEEPLSNLANAVPIEAIRDVALAAINLAKDVALNPQNG